MAEIVTLSFDALTDAPLPNFFPEKRRHNIVIFVLESSQVLVGIFDFFDLFWDSGPINFYCFQNHIVT